MHTITRLLFSLALALVAVVLTRPTQAQEAKPERTPAAERDTHLPRAWREWRPYQPPDTTEQVPAEVTPEMVRRAGERPAARWISVDPLADEYPSWSPYNYVLNNPVTYIDPNGMWVDDYFIHQDGTVDWVKTDDPTDSFYYMNGDDAQHLATLSKNEHGLVLFPNSGIGFERYGGIDAGGFDPRTGETVGSGDHYLHPRTAAALFGMAYQLAQEGITIAFGDMSSSNGSDPWQPGFPHHAGHGHQGNRSGLDVDFRYISNAGTSFQSRTATTDSRFSSANNTMVYQVATQFGFTVNYQGTRGPTIPLPTVRPARGHNDHGHLGYRNY